MGDANKPNKFNQQKEHAEERKAGETPTQGEPVTEPKKEEVIETPATPEKTEEKK